MNKEIQDFCKPRMFTLKKIENGCYKLYVAGIKYCVLKISHPLCYSMITDLSSCMAIYYNSGQLDLFKLIELLYKYERK